MKSDDRNLALFLNNQALCLAESLKWALDTMRSNAEVLPEDATSAGLWIEAEKRLKTWMIFDDACRRFDSGRCGDNATTHG